VPDLTVRPTAKFLKAGAILAGVIFIALEAGYYLYLPGSTPWLMLIPLLVFIWPASRAFRRRFTQAVISGDRLRYETGLASKSTRTIQLTKVQDVRVDQRVMQRIFNVGDIAIETAGEASRLTIHNIDAPQALADEILNRSQRGAAQV
jgi:uncharacterized membrane protein YdbT with pleckstrin-like domain